MKVYTAYIKVQISEEEILGRKEMLDNLGIDGVIYDKRVRDYLYGELEELCMNLGDNYGFEIEEVKK